MKKVFVFVIVCVSLLLGASMCVSANYRVAGATGSYEYWAYYTDDDLPIGADIAYVSTSVSGDLVIPNTVEVGGGLAACTVTGIGYAAFGGCKNITSIVIPSTVIGIDRMAFYKCTNLKSVNLSEGLLEIGEQAFEYCESLIDITLPVGLQSIGRFAFSGCSSLESIRIPGEIGRAHV